MPEIYEGVLTPQDEFNLKLDSINRWNAVNIEPNFDVPESKILNDPLDPGEQVDIYSAMYSDNPEIRNMALIAQQKRIAQDTRVKLDPNFTIETPYSQAAKYLDQDYGFHPMTDNEDFYAKKYEQRGTFSHILENIWKAPSRFAIGAVSKLMQTVGNIGGLFEFGRDHWMEGVSENAFAKFFYEGEQEWKDKFAPVFKPNGWEDKGFWSKFADGRFWSDELADGAAFMAEMIAANYLLGAGLGKIGWLAKASKWAPSGVGAISKAQRAALWLTGSKNLGELGSWGLNISMEALTEAAEGFKEKKRQLLEDREKGLNNFSDKEINEKAGSVGSSRFIGNIFALAASQGIENRFIFNPITRKLLRRNPNIQSKSNQIAVDEAGQAYIKGSKADKSTKWYSKLNPVKGLRTPGNASRYYAGRLLTAYGIEGLWEENAQLAIDRLSMQGTLDFTNFARQYGKQTLNALVGDDPEASTSIGLGTVIGVGGGVIAGMGERKNKMMQSKLAMTAFNNASKDFLSIYNAVELDDKGDPIYEDGLLKFNPAKLAAAFQGMESILKKQMTADDINDPVLANIMYRSAIADYYRAARIAGIDKELITRLQSISSLSEEALKKLNLGVSSKKDVSSIINMIQRQKEVFDKVESLRKPDRPEGMSVQDYFIREFTWRELLYQQYSYRDIAKEAYDSIKTRNADDIVANTNFNESITDVAHSTFMRLNARKQTLKEYYDAITSKDSKDSNLVEFYKNTMNYLETEIDRIYDLIESEGTDDYVAYQDKDEELKGRYSYLLSKTKNAEFFTNGTLKDDEDSVKAIRAFIDRQKSNIYHVASLENQFEQANFLISKLEDPEKGLITAFEYQELEIKRSEHFEPDPNNPEDKEEEVSETPEEKEEETPEEDPLMGFTVEPKDGMFLIKNPNGEFISSLQFEEEEAAINYINLNILPNVKKKEVKEEVIDYTNIPQEQLESGIRDILLTLESAGYFQELGVTFSMLEDLYVHLSDVLTNIPRHEDGEEILTKKEYSIISEFVTRQNAKVGQVTSSSITEAKADIERRRQEELDNVKPVYHHTQVKPEEFNFSSFQRGSQSISQFGDGLNASSNTTSFLVNRYGKPIQGEVNDKEFVEIDANKTEKEIYEYLKAKGYKFSRPASEYTSNEKANYQPAIIELFQDFQKSNPEVKGVKVSNHIIGGQKISSFYVIYDSKSFYGRDSLKNKINAKYDAELKTLEEASTTQSEIEAKKADIGRREEERLSNKQLASSVGEINTGNIEIANLPTGIIDKTIANDDKGNPIKVHINYDNLNGVLLSRNGKVLFRAMQGRFFIIAKVGDFYLPFYISSAGTSGKNAGEWYPFFGFNNWLVKGSVGKKGEMEYTQKVDEITNLLNENLQIPAKYFTQFGQITNGKGTPANPNKIFYDINNDLAYESWFVEFDRKNSPYTEEQFVADRTGLNPKGVKNDGKGSADAWIRDVLALTENAPLASKGKINAKYDAELAALETNQATLDAKKADIERRRQEELKNSITDSDKIIFGHPGIGKTYLKESGRTDVIDFDSDYKTKINEKFNLPKGFKARNDFQKSNKEEYQKAVRELWIEAKQEAKRTGKQLFASDMILLREFANDFDKVLTMSKDTFVNRAKQRNDYTEGETEKWKNSLDTEISKIDKSKVINTTDYLSDLFQDKINAKYDAELAALEQPKVEKSTEVEAQTPVTSEHGTAEKINLTEDKLAEIENKPLDNASFENIDFNC